ncbi:hypothetical protein Vadar_028124 [Vaccinium darrowii]|uniref:Uncharacterized protein n=1 Tax=Vaccinium darrowii TaxID=229202 RepID=A0ACB7YGE4_9ERIC|nr:hypothetical protein Vadar_028124 [Vaccinium darrowii]
MSATVHLGRVPTLPKPKPKERYGTSTVRVGATQAKISQAFKSVAYQMMYNPVANVTGAMQVTGNARVNYDSSAKNLSLYLTFDKNPAFQGICTLSYVVDLREVLPPLFNIRGPKKFHGYGPQDLATFGGGRSAVIGALSCGLACFGKASKESDDYSFGVVALEIACGRMPVEVYRDPGQVKLLEWVWSLYGKGQLFEAVDKNLTMEYVEYQVQRLMVVACWVMVLPPRCQSPIIHKAIKRSIFCHLKIHCLFCHH